MTVYTLDLVGNLTKTGDFYSGFSSDAYAKCKTAITLGTNPFEIFLKFTTLNTDDEQIVLRLNTNNALAVGIQATGGWNFNYGDGTSWHGITKLSTPSPNTTYYLKWVCNGSNSHTISVSTDGETYTVVGTATDIITIPEATINFGVATSGANPFKGSIALEDCYIKINNELVVSGITPYTYTGTHIQQRHDASTKWASVNPILLAGEIGVETDTNKIKIGDGATAYNSLDYFVGDIDLSDYYDKTEIDNLLDDKADTSDLPSIMTGATSSTAGTSGLVPAPVAGDDTKFLSGDGTYKTVGSSITVDQTYDATSTNAQSGTAVAEAVEDKVDNNELIDISELYPTLGGLSAPSNTYEDLTLNASGSEYTAPADGWVTFSKQSTAVGQYIILTSIIGNTGQYKLPQVQYSTTNTQLLRTYIRVAKNDTFMTRYTADGTTNAFRFFYSIGSESEAN